MNPGSPHVSGAVSTPDSESVHARVRARRKQEYRRAILDAAEQVFGESGYRAAKMTEIARTAGVATGTLYNYFDSKGEVIRALIERLKEELLERFSGAGAGTRGLERLRAIVLETLVAAQERGRLFAVQLEAFASDRGGTGIDVQAETEAHRAHVALVRAAIVEAVEDAELRDDLDPELMAIALVGICRDFLFVTMLGGSSRPTTELLDPIMALFVEGARSP